MESLFLTRDQTLSLWSGSTDSKTLDYQRTNPREYQIVRTHIEETTWIQDPASPNHRKYPVEGTSSNQQTKQKYKSNHQQIGLPPHSGLPIKGKQTNKQSQSVQSLSHVWLFATPWITAHQASPSITNSQSLLKHTSIE